MTFSHSKTFDNQICGAWATYRVIVAKLGVNSMTAWAFRWKLRAMIANHSA